jgi:hypothetical protein
MTAPTDSLRAAGPATRRHRFGYPKFLIRSLIEATDGTFSFYAWMTALTAVALVGLNAWAHQVTSGMILTHMTIM